VHLGAPPNRVRQCVSESGWLRPGRGGWCHSNLAGVARQVQDRVGADCNRSATETANVNRRSEYGARPASRSASTDQRRSGESRSEVRRPGPGPCRGRLQPLDSERLPEARRPGPGPRLGRLQSLSDGVGGSRPQVRPPGPGPRRGRLQSLSDGRRAMIPGAAADAGRSSVPGGPWSALDSPRR
jgi:hypothetical protein